MTALCRNQENNGLKVAVVSDYGLFIFFFFDKTVSLGFLSWLSSEWKLITSYDSFEGYKLIARYE